MKNLLQGNPLRFLRLLNGIQMTQRLLKAEGAMNIWKPVFAIGAFLGRSFLPQFLNNSVINNKYLVKSIEWTEKQTPDLKAVKSNAKGENTLKEWLLEIFLLLGIFERASKGHSPELKNKEDFSDYRIHASNDFQRHKKMTNFLDSQWLSFCFPWCKEKKYRPARAFSPWGNPFYAKVKK